MYTDNYFMQNDIEQNKTIVVITAVLQIFIPILFFLPILLCKDSPMGKFYTNQGLWLLILDLLAGVVMIVPILGWIAGAVIGIATFVFAIMNAVNANRGMKKGIPIVGDKILIK